MRGLIPITAAALLCSPVAAGPAGKTPYATVSGYAVTRAEPAKPMGCEMLRVYRSPEDGNGEKALFFSQRADGTVVSLAYDRWRWDKRKPPKVRYAIDGQAAATTGALYAEAQAIGTVFPPDATGRLRAGARIVVGVKTGDVGFDLAGFGPAYDALVRCNRDEPPVPVAQAGGGAKVETAPPAPPAPTPPPAAAVPPAPAPAASPPVAVPAGLAPPPVPSDAHAAVYALARYQHWAIDACDMRSTARQRTTLSERIEGLRPEMSAIEPTLAVPLAALGPGDCASASTLEADLRRVVDGSPEAAFATMSGSTREGILSRLGPVLANLRPLVLDPPPAAGPPGPLPSAARIAAYWSGARMRALLERCDLATTGRQRAALAARLDALAPEMAVLDAPTRTFAEAGTCPGDGAAFSRDLAAFLEKPPELFALEAEAGAGREGKGVIAGVRPALARHFPPAPPSPSRARIATYLYGLILRDVIEHCDLPTTTKQRTGLDARLADLKDEMAPHEADLQAQKGAFKGCPEARDLGELGSVLPLFVESTPEAFAAEMDRRSATRRADATAQADATGPCRVVPLPRKRAQLVADLRRGLAEQTPAIALDDSRGDDPLGSFTVHPAGPDGGASSTHHMLYGEGDEIRSVVLLTSGPLAPLRAATVATVHLVVSAYGGTGAVEETRSKLAAHLSGGKDAPRRTRYGAVVVDAEPMTDDSLLITIEKSVGRDCPRSGDE